MQIRLYNFHAIFCKFFAQHYLLAAYIAKRFRKTELRNEVLNMWWLRKNARQKLFSSSTEEKLL